MVSSHQNIGSAIAIAWPETYCKQPGYWYDGLINFLGISKHHYYKVGHAALVLVNAKTGKSHYFDFGRYHSPFQHGRVRSEITDQNLKINTKVHLSEDGTAITNFEELLNELQLNNECHGDGAIHASYCSIDFDKSYQKALQLQQIGPIPYGPFRYKGSNCSRFVNDSILAGNPHWKVKFKLNFFVPLTPTPLNNVNALLNKTVLPKLLKTKSFCPTPITNKGKLKITLEQPPRPAHLPKNAQWLSGEGAGSWFSINPEFENYCISRYDPMGELECEGIFNVKNKNDFKLSPTYKIDYLSHCQQVVINQNAEQIIFERIADISLLDVQVCC